MKGLVEGSRGWAQDDDIYMDGDYDDDRYDNDSDYADGVDDAMDDDEDW